MNGIERNGGSLRKHYIYRCPLQGAEKRKGQETYSVIPAMGGRQREGNRYALRRVLFVRAGCRKNDMLRGKRKRTYMEAVPSCQCLAYVCLNSRFLGEKAGRGGIIWCAIRYNSVTETDCEFKGMADKRRACGKKYSQPGLALGINRRLSESSSSSVKQSVTGVKPRGCGGGEARRCSCSWGGKAGGNALPI